MVPAVRQHLGDHAFHRERYRRRARVVLPPEAVAPCRRLVWRRHYGGPSGCASVKRYIDEDGDYRKGPRAIYLYGEPLPAEEVIEREWCARCGGYWFNAGGVSEDHSDEFMRKET